MMMITNITVDSKEVKTTMMMKVLILSLVVVGEFD